MWCKIKELWKLSSTRVLTRRHLWARHTEMQNATTREFKANRRRTINFQVLSSLDDIPKTKNYWVLQRPKTVKMQEREETNIGLSQLLPSPMLSTGLKCSPFHTFRSPSIQSSAWRMHEQVQKGPSWNQGTHLKSIAAAKTLAGTPLVPSQSFYTAVDGSLGSLQIFCLRCVKNERPLFASSLAQFQERCLAAS